MALVAQTVSAPDSIDNIIGFVLGVAQGIPAVGPYLVITIKILGIVAAVLTGLSAVLMALQKSFNLVGLNSIGNVIAKVLPYVQYASMFNLQKP